MPKITAAAVTLLAAAVLLAQPQPVLVFEVASIKPSSAPDGGSSGVNTEKTRVTARNVTLKRCIRAAYNVPQPQIFGGPKWVDEDRFDTMPSPLVPPPMRSNLPT